MVLKIAALSLSGAGRTEDGQVVPRTLPGEEVVPRADGTVQIVMPSPDRVTPPCRHFKTCGGCRLQHASDPVVAAWKHEIVERALAAQGLKPAFRDPHVSPPQSRRRAKFSARRTKKGALVGFHAPASDILVDVPECRILTPALLAVRPALTGLTTLAASRKAEIAITVTDSAGGPDVRVATDKPLDGPLRVMLAEWVHRHAIARLTWNDEPVVEATPPVQVMGRARVVPPPGAFLQATADAEAALVADVREIIGTSDPVVDLFAGCGTFTLPLAEGAEVHAVEGEAAMMAALDRGWRGAQGLKRVTTAARDLFRRPLEPDELARFAAAVIDPPRAGAAAQVTTLAESGIGVVAMVSCNPVTFARDAATLCAAGYRLDWVRVVDQFRWSAHVEMVGAFTHA